MMSEHQSMRPDTTGRIEMSEADPVSSPNVTNNKGANKDPQIVSFTSGEERSHTQAQAQAQNTSPQNPLLTDEEAGLASTAPPVALV